MFVLTKENSVRPMYCVHLTILWKMVPRILHAAWRVFACVLLQYRILYAMEESYEEYDGFLLVLVGGLVLVLVATLIREVCFALCALNGEYACIFTFPAVDIGSSFETN